MPFCHGLRCERRTGFIPKDSTTLATYRGTTIPAAAAVERDGWRNVYFASAPLPSWVLRHVAKMAGSHQYVEGDDVVYVGRSHLVVHTAVPGRRVVLLPRELTVKDAATGHIVGAKMSRVGLRCEGPTTWLLEVAQ